MDIAAFVWAQMAIGAVAGLAGMGFIVLGRSMFGRLVGLFFLVLAAVVIWDTTL
ncbi:MAG: hypothetical protein AB7P02_08605 [Alphaproteobacteria bacterium]